MGMIINPYRFGGAALLLDTYTGATAAYSLRKLRMAYAGYCIEVRRDSDNTTQNIGFSNGVLDESALTSFVGANDGFVKTWYDQSGSNNATMATAGTQPQIIASGSTFLVNNKITLKFVAKRLDHAMNISGASTLHSLFAVVSPIANSVYSMPFAQGDNSNSTNGIQLLLNCGDVSNKWGTYKGISISAGSVLSNAAQYLLGMIRNGSGNGTFYINGGTDGTYPSTSGSTSKSIGNSTYSNEYTQEVIFYNSDQSANISGIRTNINSFYSIY